MNEEMSRLYGFYETYSTEVIAFWVLIVSIAVLLRGIRVNYRISRQVFESVGDYLESQFSRSALIPKSFWMDSWSQFDIFSTGRKGCPFMYMNVICRPRQDILTGVLLYPFLGYYDKLYIEIPLESLGPIIILVCKKKELKSTLIEYPEIEIHCSPKKLNNLPRGIVVYANSNACIEALMTTNIFSKFINSQISEKLFNYIYISDQTTCPRLTNSYSKVANVVKSSIKMPSKDDIELMNNLYGDSNYFLRNLLLLCDKLGGIKLPEKTLQHISKNRMEIERSLNMINSEKVKERFDARRREKFHAEALKVSRMSPKEQKKYQEKKDKEQARSRIKIRKVRC
ncbi:putative transmembrane protein [Cryptosporidium felis]|nr:putative transmembrane protein [Cryptosporidium felis]